MSLQKHDLVESDEFGPGRIVEVLGDIAIVDFAGEELTVTIQDLVVRERRQEKPALARSRPERLRFRQAFEAINLGIVPPDPEELVSLTISGEQVAQTTAGWLEAASSAGLCKIVLGDYGAGKTHLLNVIKGAALTRGWVVSYVEFDPKEADPAKPFLVYRALCANLRFPSRANGAVSRSFLDLVQEIRHSWSDVSAGRLFRASRWFRTVLPALRAYPHAATEEYKSVCGWLSGAPVHLSAVHRFVRSAGVGALPPPMPRTKECAEIYVFHLAVLNEVCRALGYRGLLIILDEAEHVRGFNVRRKERANNFFDILARAAHQPLSNASPIIGNEHMLEVPEIVSSGPHFGVVVGLTEGAMFSDPSIDVREACAFAHEQSDLVRLGKPSPDEYQRWCRSFLDRCHGYDPETMSSLSRPEARESLARILAREFGKSDDTGQTLRLWVKLAALGPSIAMAQQGVDAEEIGTLLQAAVDQATGRVLPWEAI